MEDPKINLISINLLGSPENWMLMNNNEEKYYYLNTNGEHSYNDAKEFCINSGGKLAEPRNSSENENLNFRDFKGIYI